MASVRMGTRLPAASSTGPARYRTASPTAVSSVVRLSTMTRATAPAYPGCFGLSLVGARYFVKVPVTGFAYGAVEAGTAAGRRVAEVLGAASGGSADAASR